MRDALLSRRRLLERTAGTAGAVAIVGCLEGEGDGDEDGADDEAGIDDGFAPAFPEIEDPPEAVYLPTHREAMHALEPVRAGPYAFAPALTYPHPFWLVSGDDVERVEPSGDAHLMLTALDRETGAVVPVDASVTLEIYADDSFVSEPNAWPMISQQMGFHFGDNVQLEGDGTYRVEGRIAPLAARTTGAFADRFDEATTFAFEFPFDDEVRSVAREVEYFDEERWGDPGAVEPMGRVPGASDRDEGSDEDDGTDHDGANEDDGGDRDAETDSHHGDDDGGDHDHPPYSALPPADALPGRLQGTPTGGDAVFATTILEPGSRFVDGDDRYLAVSPRTPYNRCVLPLMAIEATLEGDGETTARDLRETLDDELGYHYGTALSRVADGDDLALEVRVPPQVARHRGYETAFVDVPQITLSLSIPQ